MQQQQENFLPRLIMVTEPDLKAKAISSYLEKEMVRKVTIVSSLEEASALLNAQYGFDSVYTIHWDDQFFSENNTEKFYDSSYEKIKVLVLLDVEYLDLAEVHKWWKELSCYSEAVISLFNVSNENEAVNLMGVGKFDGVIYKDVALEVMEKGVDFMLKGQMWLSRGLMSRLINEMLRSSVNSAIDNMKLTRREAQILKMIGIGVCNAEISEQLFISEHTVKTHIYNIYKKIDVNNREDAKKWVKNNFH
ncbi:MAG: LuxR C-terminal-related transcriptional regulator [Pseudomonadota bacterium]